MTIIYSSKPLRKRDKNDFYPTPIELCREILFRVRSNEPTRKILDTGCGTGIWGEAYRKVHPNLSHTLTGIDLRNIDRNPHYDYWIDGEDFLTYDFKNNTYDIIMGNPPYKFAEEFIDKSLSLLSFGGSLVYLLRLSFLESEKRYKKYYSCGLNPDEVLISTRRVSFTGNRKSDNTAYAVYIWTNGVDGMTKLGWLNWKYDKNI